MTAYGPLGISGDILKGYSPLLHALCSYTVAQQNLRRIRKQMSTSKVWGNNNLNLKESNFFPNIPIFFLLNIVHGRQIKIVILPTVYLIEKNRNGNRVSSDFLPFSFTKNHGETQAAQSSGYHIVRNSELRDFTPPLISLSASGLPDSGMLIPGFIRSYLIDHFSSLALLVIAKASIHQGT